ncbi:MAG: SRPBCC domain-containing protein [Chloroflexota bacterium]|nr:SRPBCC domain-containing protein [Chloroflexota bacterium]
MTVNQSVHVKRSLDDAFHLFVDEMGKWWPLHTGHYSYGGDRAKEIYLEPRLGGRFYERFKDGEEFVVGHVIACDRPNHIVFTWTAGEAGDTQVDVTFRTENEGTRVGVEHRGLEKMGQMGQGFEDGWKEVLGYFGQAAGEG